MNARSNYGDDQAFELPDLAPPVHLPKGSRVRVQTIWGHELGQILNIKSDPGARLTGGAPASNAYPLAEVLMDKGDTIYINVARCTLIEEPDDA